MARKAVVLNIQGIKCDNPACDFRDESIKFEDYGKYLNKPCPKCQANLLTQKDLESIIKLIMLTNVFNSILPKPDGNTPRTSIAVEMDGTGEVRFTPCNK